MISPSHEQRDDVVAAHVEERVRQAEREPVRDAAPAERVGVPDVDLRQPADDERDHRAQDEDGNDLASELLHGRTSLHDVRVNLIAMRTSSLVLVLALASCGKDPAKASEAPPPTPPVAAPATVQIFVNEAVVGTIALDQVKLWPRLDALVPTSARHLGSWDDVYLHGKAPKPTELHKPSASYPDYVPALFPGEDGKPAFGLFDPVELAKHGKAAVREDDVTEVRIKMAAGDGHGQNEQGNAAATDPNRARRSQSRRPRASPPSKAPSCSRSRASRCPARPSPKAGRSRPCSRPRASITTRRCC